MRTAPTAAGGHRAAETGGGSGVSSGEEHAGCSGQQRVAAAMLTLSTAIGLMGTVKTRMSFSFTGTSSSRSSTALLLAADPSGSGGQKNKRGGPANVSEPSHQSLAAGCFGPYLPGCVLCVNLMVYMMCSACCADECSSSFWVWLAVPLIGPSLVS